MQRSRLEVASSIAENQKNATVPAGGHPWGGAPPGGSGGGAGAPPGGPPGGSGGGWSGWTYDVYGNPYRQRLMKLPTVTSENYAWDGNSSTLRSHINKWTAEFSMFTPNEVIPFIRTLVPEEHRWRLKRVTTFWEAMQALIPLTSSEDVYVVNLVAEIHARPHCSSYREDKAFLLFLSKKVDELIEIQPQYHLSPGLCT